ncbi:hypothetical protein K491DRAFT_609882 [Lophiostoma macrostomum CBS 122681]|uniref:NAD(P)-binding protein n=1 Tax=Lophiostoma macrostomum CBS 122681 TaxID=1314788 RepID=A0A6A6STH1_9PLEO|nr:hypothetical protein K491DRAFT_609882 [Lophiostoma macrostomum CBS 122681]
MASSILITGAAGYMYVHPQVNALLEQGVNVIQLNLLDETAVSQVILQHNIDIVIQTASSIDPSLSLPLISALALKKQNTGVETYFIHTSGLSAFYPRTGWTEERMKDTDAIFEIEKGLADTFPIRNTDVTISEYAQKKRVTSYILVPSTVYGKGSGVWNRLSVVMPNYISGAISQGAVYKFAKNTKVSGVHISDLTSLYALIIKRILHSDPPASGTKGYYFALAHDLIWWEVLDNLAASMKARGLVKDTRLKVWPSDQVAAEAMGVPEMFVQPLWNSGENLVSDNRGRLGWKPMWDKERFLKDIDDEVDAVLELGKAKSSLMDSLNNFSKG